MSIIVVQAGPLTTIQDKGRFGYQRSGIGQAGAMDQEAYAAANKLAGNLPGAAVLEMTMLGATLRFTEKYRCALTGAEMEAKLDGVPQERYKSFTVEAGQTLVLGFAKTGLRGYLAVQGGIEVPKVLGSRSTDIKSHLGGLEGRALKNGDELEVGEGDGMHPIYTSLPVPDYPEEVVVRAILGPQDDYFTEKGNETFFKTSYAVTPQSDRMGIRLEGAAIENKAGVDIVSDGITFGSVQIPANGMPIVLMADHQTAGGYAKIATVVSADLPKLAQLKPGQRVSFRQCSVLEAQLVPSDKLLSLVEKLPPETSTKSKGLWDRIKELLGL